ncbi:MAG: Nramp family divalent metal transporter, partial [Chloroflexi bacterium]|nr:Nramp family divalent metal transporter [Chloroflexota bacterium]
MTAHSRLASAREKAPGILPFLGPGFVASIAYIDPGNFATNIQSGARFGYLLLWVVLASNLIGTFVQVLSAKL